VTDIIDWFEDADWTTAPGDREIARVAALEAKLAAACDVVRDLERRANDRLSGSPARDAGLHIQAVMTAAQLRRALGMPERANSRPGWQLREAWRRP
jgi:hypothetical protein